MRCTGGCALGEEVVTCAPNTTSVVEKIEHETSKLSVYPNPFQENFTIQIEESTAVPSLREQGDNPIIKMTDLLGREVKNIEYRMQNNEIQINAKGLQKGIYLVEIEGVGRTKIVKQ